MQTYSANSHTEKVQIQYVVKTFMGVPQIGVRRVVRSDGSWRERFVTFTRVVVHSRAS